MAKLVPTDYETPIEVGTRLDDGRVNANALYIQTGDKLTLRVLTKTQVLNLTCALLETLNELPVEDTTLHNN